MSFFIFAIWISFFDTYHLIDRIKSVNTLHELETERDFFKEEIIKYRRQIYELDHDKESLEKFAREQHLMKKENEDVYIILDAE
ncbi:MAG: septum formation initiator family protein [Bacteroidota bacterium]|nr:septum formation initiator family protein [Bacteroidota bacterium]